MIDQKKPDGYAMFRDGKLVLGEWSGVITIYRQELEKIAADDVQIKPVWISETPPPDLEKENEK